MASEWNETTLGEFVALQRGHDLTEPQRRIGSVPVMGSAGQNGFHDIFRAKGPGIVIGRSGASFGQVHFSEKDYWPHNTALYVTNFKSNDPKFAFYFLKAIDFSRYNSGSAQPSLNRNFVYPIPVRIPPLAEQKRIAHILGTLDDKIELNRRMNVTLEAMARALFESWFVDYDPVRRKVEGGESRPEDFLFPDSFQDSAIGEIPTEWEPMPLYETATYRNGAPFKSSDFCPSGDGLPVVKIAELKSGLTEQTKWSNKQLGSDQMIDTGDLLYSWSGSPDTSLDAFLWSNGPGLVNQHIFKVITSNDAEKRFVYYLLKHLRPILVETARDKQTTGLGHVTVADMKRLQVCRPPKDVLAAFDRLIAPIFDKAFANTVESQTLVTLRDTLLPKLLSGEQNTNELEFVSS
jgi:type I restriction enzyme, S subunit